jgi:hypothetical protein
MVTLGGAHRAAVLLMVLCTTVALAGCSSSSTTTGTATAPPPSSAAVTRKVDLLRLAEIKDAFPPGYAANPLYGPQKLDAREAESAGDFVSYGEPLTVEPDPCRVLLNPIRANAGAETASVTTATEPQDPFIAVSVYDPVSVPAAIPGSGCDRFTFVVKTAIPDGMVERLAAPSIDGASTYALKAIVTVDNNPVEGQFVEYFYTAILDGRTFVNLWARVPSDFTPEPALPDLLTKAVTALRGR